ncbi:MAG: response regulator [Spirochaetales bacterium]|nr:response regulator [Spirochaetales bacterium]
MEIKSFTKTIYKSTIISSFILNSISVIILFIICSSLIAKIYESQYKTSVTYINNTIMNVIDISNIEKKIIEYNLTNNNELILEIETLANIKKNDNKSTYVLLLSNKSNIDELLPTNIQNFFTDNKTRILNDRILHNTFIYNNKIFITDYIFSERLQYLQIFELTDFNEINKFNNINKLSGFDLNGNCLKLENNTYVKNVNMSQLKHQYNTDINGLRLCFTNDQIFKDNLILFSIILFFSLIRVISTLLETRRHLKIVTKPLNELVLNTEKLAAHEISEKLNRFDYPYSEFKQLAEAFNKVLLSRELSEIKLFRSFEQMENVVHKRTQELISANEQLTHAMKKAEEANALKSQFLANISHEIRTPLNCIMGFCDIILTEDHSEAVTVQVQQILHESETLLHLINDFLDYSKIDAGKMNIVEAELNIRSIVNSLLKSGQTQIGNKDIKLISHVSKNVPSLIISDELRLYQVISNIFYNAIKFTPRGSVTINIDSLNNLETNEILLLISVIDTGIGIPENRKLSIFNKFEQVDGSLTRKYRGSGLGLTICKKIVELMNGEIEVISEMNKGTSFIIKIPVKAQEIIIPSVNKNLILEESSEHTTGSHILLVEDYAVNQIVAKKHLEMDNHIVTVAENGQEAIDLCEKNNYDLILMDLQMPIMDGFTATKIIRSNLGINSKTPILAMTANAMDTAKQTCLDSGMDGIITKPIRKKMFLREVDKWLKVKIS